MPTIAEQMQTLGTKFEPTNGNNSKSNLKSPGGYRVKPAYDALGHYGPRKANEPFDAELEKDPFRFSTLAYPRDVTQDMANGHYMLFYVNVQNKTKFKYKDVDNVTVGDSKEYVVQSEGNPHQDAKTKIFTGTGANAAEVEYANRLVRTGRGNKIMSDGVDLRRGRKATGGLAKSLKSTTRITDSVAIYLPAVAKDDLSAEYSGVSTGLAGLAAAGGIDFVKAMERNDFEGASRELISGAKTIVGESLKTAAAEIVDMIPGVEGSLDLFNKAFGQAENPYMEVIFKNLSLREFEYSFQFAPRSEDETHDVQAIIKLFRYHMAPELKGNNHRYLTLPSTFDIHYMFQDSPTSTQPQENSFYSKIATCVLETVSVDYSPGGVHSFADGAPTQINMTLNFKETELLTKDKINDGF
jgi:hypothetical protein